MENLVHALVFVINTVLNLFTACILLRFLMQQVRADFYNPLAQVVMKLTNPLLLPLRRFIRPWNRIDTAALVLVFVVQLLNVVVVTFLANLLSYELHYTPGYLLMWTLLKLAYILVNLYVFSIMLEAVLSWFSQGRSSIDSILRPLNAPLLRPVRRLLPPTSGLDFSPLVILLLLLVISYYVLPHIWPMMGI